MEFGKIAVLAVVTALSAVIVRKQAPEIAVVLVLLGAALILKWGFSAISGVRYMLEQLQEIAGISPAILSPVIKTVGIAILTRFTAELCRDTKEGGLASFVETVGTATALVLSVPLLESVLAMITELLQ